MARLTEREIDTISFQTILANKGCAVQNIAIPLFAFCQHPSEYEKRDCYQHK